MKKKNRFDVSKTKLSLTIVFSSTMENIDSADNETRDFLKQLGLESETFSVSLIMREALTNAVKHGNRFDTDKDVRYSIWLEDRSLKMEVEDQGEGFDWEKVRDKQLEVFLSQSLLASIENQNEDFVLQAIRQKKSISGLDHGRGMTIMELYFTNYKYNDKGNKLFLTKDL